MSFDPTDPSGRHRPRPRPQLSRRDFLRGGLWVGAGIGAAPILAACNNAFPAVESAGYPLARPNNPVTLPFADSNPPIDDGLDPETGGAFKILNYEAYMAPGVMKDFGAKYDVEVQVTPYSNYDEMLAKLRTPGESFDLVFPGPSVLSKMVFAELIQPMNHSYIPNLENLWLEYQDPWYDREARYTVPYTIYGTGVMYRADRVTSIPDNGYDLLWDEQYSGEINLLDDLSEAIGMSLLRNHITTDINTGNPAFVQEATNSLIDLIGLVNVKTDVSAYSQVPEGTSTIHQAWSGDPIAGQYYLPKGETPEVLGYWRPDNPAARVVGSDNIAIPHGAAKPVLSHLMINDLLDNDIALQNFGFNGYQPPLTKLSARYLIDQGYIPENLMSAVVLPDDFDRGLTFYEVTPDVEALWRQFWSEFKAGG